MNEQKDENKNKVNGLQPPKIKWDDYRPTCYLDMIHDACLTTKLSSNNKESRPEKLLKYYASQAQDFRPALRTIQAATGINAIKISMLRAQLVEYGLINYDHEKKMLTILWKSIRALAMITPEERSMYFTGVKQHSEYFKPQSSMPTIGQLELELKPTRIQKDMWRYVGKPAKRVIPANEKKFWKYIEGMTEDEELAFIRLCPGGQDIQQPTIVIEEECYDEDYYINEYNNYCKYHKEICSLS